MEPQIRTLVDISSTPAALQGRADIMLEHARWAATVFQRYDRSATMDIVDATAEMARDNAQYYADWAVRETGFGVIAHKKIKNELSACPLVDFYRDQDFVNARIDESQKIVEIPRAAGVIFALTPSTNPIATLNCKIILALMTRNAIVISPHPAAKACCIDAANKLTDAAISAGAPKGTIQILEEPTIPLIEAFMASPKTNVILATGGVSMVRSAYSSSNPAIGVGPGNAPVLVDSSADISSAAQRIVDSKSFDNSVLCTSESVLITLPDVQQQLKLALKSSHAHLCSSEEVDRLRRLLFHDRGFNVECIGRDAVWIAKECGIRVGGNTKILVTPIEQIGQEEPLTTEKLCPVLAFYIAKNINQAINQAKAVLRLTGAGHSAAIHSRDEQVAMAYASSVEAYRVVVNAPCSQGAAGFSTNLAPAFTVGTGYFGRSTVGENVGPQHLVHWTRMAYNSDDSEQFGNYFGLAPSFDGPLPRAPSDGVPGFSTVRPVETHTPAIDDLSRERLRQIITEELEGLLRK